MGLDISAVDYIKTDIQKATLFEKYNIPKEVQKIQNNDDLWDWLFSASTSSTAELKDSDDELERLALKWRNELQKKLKSKAGYDSVLKEKRTASQVSAGKALDEFHGDYEVDDFSIGYGGFYFMRVELAKCCGGKYYRRENGSYMGELRFQYPSEWEKTREGRATKDFFFHSDCDGEFSEAKIHAFAKFLRDNHVRPKVVKHCTSAWKPKVLEFIDFVDRSSKGTICWKFI